MSSPIKAIVNEDSRSPSFEAADRIALVTVKEDMVLGYIDVADAQELVFTLERAIERSREVRAMMDKQKDRMK